MFVASDWHCSERELLPSDPFPDGVAMISEVSAVPRVRYSICTLVTKPAQYAELVESFRRGGFTDDCEYLCIDNSVENRFDAYRGGNLCLAQAQGERII